MKTLIFSDLHGSRTACKRLLEIFENEGFEQMLILGDFSNYGPRNGVPSDLDAPSVVEMLNAYADRIVAVRGNCDSEVDQMLFSFPMMCDYQQVEVPIFAEKSARIFLTHGHIYNNVRRPGVATDVLLFGHTHLWMLERTQDGVVVCNPGSPTFPKGGNPPTYATLEDGCLCVKHLQSSETLEMLEI